VIFVGFVVATPTPTSLRTLAGTDVTWATTLPVATEAVGPDFELPAPVATLTMTSTATTATTSTSGRPEQHPATAGCGLPFLRGRGPFRGQPLPSG
jgi:hypothetical protein